MSMQASAQTADPRVAVLFRAHAPYVWRVLRHLGIPDRDLEDACQEVFVVVHDRIATFEDRGHEATSWLYAIARRVASSRRRTARRRPLELPGELPERGQGSTQERTVELRRQWAVLQDLLRDLDDEQREVLILFEIEELPMKQVAAMCGCPISTAYYRLNAAREALRVAFRRRELNR